MNNFHKKKFMTQVLRTKNSTQQAPRTKKISTTQVQKAKSVSHGKKNQCASFPKRKINM